MASGVHLYKHECYDCAEVEWSLLSTHKHQTEHCGDEHHHHLTTDFHHNHEKHTNHCEASYYKIDKPFMDSQSIELDAPAVMDLPVSSMALCNCLLGAFISIDRFEQDRNLSPPLDVTRMFEVYLL